MIAINRENISTFCTTVALAPQRHKLLTVYSLALCLENIKKKNDVHFFVNNDRLAFSTGCYSKRLEWLLGPLEQTLKEVKVFSSNGLSHFIKRKTLFYLFYNHSVPCRHVRVNV